MVQDARAVSVLQDAYGNRHTYAHLGEVSQRYAAPKTPGPEDLRDVEAELAKEHDPRPTGPASAGQRGPSAGEPRKVLVRVAKSRLFAHPSAPPPTRPRLGDQIEQYSEALPEDASLSEYFVGDFPIKREDLVLRTLHEGSQVVGGTVLGRTAQRGLRFRVRPAGKGARRSTRGRSWTAGGCSRTPRSTAGRRFARWACATPRSASSC